jgi:hypothetical protein
MPAFRITAPDGTVYNVTGPDGSTREQALAQVQAQHKMSPPNAAIAAKVNNDQISQDAKNGPSALGELGQQVGNLIAGGVRGAGSIGATLAYPIDKATDLIKGDRGPTMSSLITGAPQPLSRNEQRRADMDWSLRDVGADTNSPAYKVGKVGAEIAGTAGAGGAAANVAGRVPIIAEAAPNLLQAIRTGGMSANAAAAQAPLVAQGAGNVLTRVAGGAINGGVSAGMVDPSNAGAGAAIGGAVPVVAKVAGAAGNAIGNVLRGPEQTPELAAAVQKARSAGYVIPPTQANPTLLNRILEGFSGKIATAQNASARNAEVTNAIVGKDIGLPEGATITPEALDGLRAKAGEAYANVAGQGKFNAAGADLPQSANVQKGYDNLTLAPKTEVDAKDLVSAWKQANADKNAYYTAYGRDAQPDTLKKAQAAASNASAIHDFLRTQIDAQEGKTADQLLADVAAGRLSTADLLKKTLANVARSNGAPGAVDSLDAARTQIAKTYNVENALNPVTGTVNAQKLAAQQAKGKQLTGGLKDAADFAGRFPKAAHTPEAMGSLPGASPLDFMASAITPDKLLSLLTLGGRPLARKLALSPLVQNRLIQSQSPNAFLQLSSDPDLAQLAYRASPNALTGR